MGKIVAKIYGLRPNRYKIKIRCEVPTSIFLIFITFHQNMYPLYRGSFIINNKILYKDCSLMHQTRLAQLVERRTFTRIKSNPVAEGSSPSSGVGNYFLFLYFNVKRKKEGISFTEKGSIKRKYQKEVSKGRNKFHEKRKE